MAKSLCVFLFAMLTLVVHFGALEATGTYEHAYRIPSSSPSFYGMSPTFYAKSCPKFASIVKKHVKAAMKKEASTTAGLLRLAFHDCWVQGPGTELTSPPNVALEGFDLIAEIKSELEHKCKGVVSCADILQESARDAIVMSGGHHYHYDVPLGRKDATVSIAAKALLPEPFDSVDQLLTQFANKMLDHVDLAALSGAHSVGDAGCKNFKSRLSNNDPTLNKKYAAHLHKVCKLDSPTVRIVAENDPVTPDKLDNQYYRNLLVKKGLFSSDEGLLSHPATRPLVLDYAKNRTHFAMHFAQSMFKLITLPPFQSTRGTIRSNCSAINN